MEVIIPQSVIWEINRIYEGRKKKKKKNKYSKEELLSKAQVRFEFLNSIAQTEPISTFLKKQKIKVLDNFNPYYSKDVLAARGNIWLEIHKNNTHICYWMDADIQSDKCINSHFAISKEDIEGWDQESLERFASLTENQIWKNVKKFLATM